MSNLTPSPVQVPYRDYGPTENPYAPIDEADAEVMRLQTDRSRGDDEHAGYGQAKDLAFGLLLALVIIVALIIFFHPWG